MHKYHISYEEFHDHTLDLYEKVKHLNLDYIVGPSRGGLLPGVILSHKMNVPLVPVEWSTRDHGIKVSRLDVADDLREGKNILLVDDINDTGKTLVDLIEDWSYNTESKGTLTTASVFQRYTTSKPSDHFQVLITDDTWLVFPYEAE